MNKELSAREIQETNSFIKNFLVFAAILSVVIGLVLTALLFYNKPALEITKEATNTQQKTENDNEVESYFDLNSNIGGFIGGIAGALFSLSSVLLLFLTLRNQKESDERGKIEARFFELTKLHCENIQELLYRNGRTNTPIAEGRKVFKEVYEQILEASEISRVIFKYIDPRDCLKSEIQQKVEAKQLNQLATISLAYTIVFFGVAKNNDNSTLNALKKDFNEDFAIHMITFFRLIPAKYEESDRKNWNKIVKENLLSKKIFDILIDESYLHSLPNSSRFMNAAILINSHSEFVDLHARKLIFYKRFGGHQHKLGHYYRHLFQTVKYIDQQNILSYSEKYEYMKTLRAQLSNYEQYVFFYNSIAYVGREWEFNYLNPLNSDRLLFSAKYNLIKNIPDVKANERDIQSFYKLIDFEFETPSASRKTFAREHWEENSSYT